MDETYCIALLDPNNNYDSMIEEVVKTANEKNYQIIYDSDEQKLIDTIKSRLREFITDDTNGPRSVNDEAIVVIVKDMTPRYVLEGLFRYFLRVRMYVFYCTNDYDSLEVEQLANTFYLAYTADSNHKKNDLFILDLHTRDVKYSFHDVIK